MGEVGGQEDKSCWKYKKNESLVKWLKNMKNLANENFPVPRFMAWRRWGKSSKLWAVGVSDGSGREGREVNPPDLCLAQIKGYLVYWSLSVHWLHLSPRLYSNILSSTQQTTRLCLHHKRWTEWELSDKFYCLNISWWLTMWEVRYSPPPTLRVLWGRIWLNNTCVGSRLEGGGGGMEGRERKFQ